jgi:2Fe-2S ferredoxin
MIQVTYLQADGRSHTVEAQAGKSLMATAVAHNIPGIDADCGGECICATCHVHIDMPWRERLAPAEEAERWTLELAVEPHPDTSRLSCQIRVDDSMHGLVVRLPPSQRYALTRPPTPPLGASDESSRFDLPHDRA